MGLAYQPNHIFQNFIVVGAGGTGSRILAQLAQLIPTVQWIKRLSPSVFVYDDDIVEEKNIARQLFTRKDVGKKKAAVIAERYSKAYEIPITAIDRRISHEGDIVRSMKAAFIKEGYTEEQAINRMMRPTMVFLAVDSMAARRNVIAALAQGFFPYSTVIIDPGNEDTFGQVRVFNPFVHPVHHKYLGYAEKHMDWVNAIPDMTAETIPMTFIPMPLSHYLTAEDGTGTGSCADLDQTLALNSMMASACISIAQNLMFCLPVTADVAYFSLNMDNHSHKMGMKWLKSICKAEHDDYVSEALLKKLECKLSWEDFVEKLYFTECAYEALKDHIGITLKEDQVNLLKNVLMYSCINLEMFDAGYAAKQAAITSEAEALEVAVAEEDDGDEGATDAG